MGFRTTLKLIALESYLKVGKNKVHVITCVIMYREIIEGYVKKSIFISRKPKWGLRETLMLYACSS